MKSEDIQILSAYMDGELTAAERAAVEQRLAQDEELRTLLRMLRLQDATLRNTIDNIENIPLKPELQHLLAASEKTPFFSDPRIRNASALAVSLAAGILVLAVLVGKPDQERAPETQKFARTGEPVSTEIALVLASMVAGESRSLKRNNKHSVNESRVTESRVTERVAFTRKDGVLCKHYAEQHADYSYEALACLEDKEWIVRALVAMNTQSTAKPDEYQPASHDASAIDIYIEDHIAGTSLSVEQERELLQRQ